MAADRHSTLKGAGRFALLLLPLPLFASVTAEGAVYVLGALGAALLILPPLKYLVVTRLFKTPYRFRFFYPVGVLEVIGTAAVVDLDGYVMIALYLLSASAINLLYFPLESFHMTVRFALKVLLLTLATPLFLFGALIAMAAFGRLGA